MKFSFKMNILLGGGRDWKKGWVRLEEDLNRVVPWAIVPWPCWLH